MAHNNIASNFNCTVLVIKQPTTPLTTEDSNVRMCEDSSTTMNFCHVEIAAGL
ncbi:hypothetical protein U1Q18_005077, partial [Sarracenia purpurea var. burkii]